MSTEHHSTLPPRWPSKRRGARGKRPSASRLVRLAWAWFAGGVFAAGCGAAASHPAGTAHEAPATEVGAASSAAEAPQRFAERCDNPVPVFEDGREVGRACEEELRREGLTVLDLGDEWVPFIFSEEDGSGRQPYREAYLGLAQENFRRLPPGVRRERHLELFGIFPTFRVLRKRYFTEELLACDAAVENTALSELRQTVTPFRLQQQRRSARSLRALEHELEAAKAARGVASLDELAAIPRHAGLVRRYRNEHKDVRAIRAMQGHLRCEGLLPARAEADVFDARTAEGLTTWQRRHMVVYGGRLDPTTRELLAMGVRERAFVALLRVLRERVIDSTGLIEDGSGSRQWGTVLDRHIEAPEFRARAGHGPARNGAPDLVSQATEAAATALGLTSFDGAVAFFGGLQEQTEAPTRVAVRLPPQPAYYGAHMDLRAEIDRGDVWYQYPYTDTGGVRGHPVQRRPVTTLYVRHGEEEVALIRWGTTIGGWKEEHDSNGKLQLAYKDSPVGPRVWRDVVASPAWLPPANTPPSDLVTRDGRSWVPNLDLFGPSYRSAYGLVMLMHHQHEPRRSGEAAFRDEGIRTHGSVSYPSILRGTSHGCHRLFNHMAVRLASFVVKHRNHARRGPIPVDYGLDFQWQGQPHSFRIESRGYRFELTPPVPVNVLEGRVRGPVNQPLGGFHPLREDLLADSDEGLADPNDVKEE